VSLGSKTLGGAEPRRGDGDHLTGFVYALSVAASRLTESNEPVPKARKASPWA